ncbi:MAG: fatty acid desaturase [Nevskiales bacterium]
MTTQVLTPESSWKDAKRYLWLLSPMLPVIGLVMISVAYLFGISSLYWGMPVLFYGIFPLLDRMIGDDRSNAPESVVAALEQDNYYRAIVYSYLPGQYLATIVGAWLAVTAGLATWEMLGLIVSVGMVNGVGINTAHELGHKKESLDRWLAKLTLAPVAYGHFFVEHNKGHHKNVATPEDPASSKMGETFWAFLPRTMIGSVRSAWNIEKARLERKGEPVLSTQNENLQAWAMTVAFFGGLTLWLGIAALPFLLVQAFYGAALLEVVNYIEHYGLLRQFDEKTGRYERCKPEHSWNNNNIVTNLVLYQLQRHSDHHANPTRSFQALRHFDESPQLPAGYAAMILVAYIPWLWFRQMDHRVAAHYKGDLSKANLYGPKRDKLIKKWSNAQFDDGRPELFPAEKAGSQVNTSDASCYQCTDCGYIYNEAAGCEHEGFAPGTPWSAIPDDWACPDCAVREKLDFKPVVPDKPAKAA